MEFTREYFIEKFEAIPKDKWCTDFLNNPEVENCHCALGHCGVKDMDTMTNEADVLNKLLEKAAFKVKGFYGGKGFNVYTVNDRAGTEHLGSHPKERILNALRDIF